MMIKKLKKVILQQINMMIKKMILQQLYSALINIILINKYETLDADTYLSKYYSNISFIKKNRWKSISKSQFKNSKSSMLSNRFDS